MKSGWTLFQSFINKIFCHVIFIQSSNQCHLPYALSFFIEFQNVASAKHSGMRHPSWREPKPLKAASRPATAQDDVNGLPRRKPSLQRSNTTIDSRQNRGMQGIVNRLTAPTLAAKMKTIEFNKRTAFVDNNYYSWSNMAVYKDHQKMLYNDGGGIKRRTTATKR